MCRGVPGCVLTVEGSVATVDFWGTQKDVRLELIDEPVVPGDHVLCHVGYAVRRIPPEDVGEMLALYDGLLTEDEPAQGVHGDAAVAPRAAEEPASSTK